MLLSTTHTFDAAVIDLGPVGEARAPDADRGPEGLPRGWGLLLALGLVLSLVSAVPLPEAPREVTRQPLRNGAFHLVGGALLVLQSDRTPTPVAAFDGADGSTRWTYTPDGLATLSYAAAGGDLVVLSPDLCRSGVTGLTVAVDLRSGAQRWQAIGVPVRTAPGVAGTVVLRSLWSDGCGALAANAPIGGALRWQALDADGRTRWEIPVDAGTRVAVDTAEAGAAWAALADRQGAVSVADFATGTRTSAGALRAGPDDLVAAAGDLLVLASFDLSGAALTAYRRGAWAAPAWRARVPARPASGRTDRFTVRPCGRVLCVAGERTVVLDPATGAVLWSAADRTDLTAVPGGLLAAAGARPAVLLDPATGAPAARLTGWDVLGADAHRVLLGAVTGDRTLLGFGAGTGVAPFATVDARLDGCELDGPLVACRTGADEVLLLRLAA
ncbi:PQQ-binding-like beta-propeller repeat protein [Dactylosporangium sp. CA-092794]|uniref:outer membrane protein assembly factor BamB family protein n=1 Tax=Dactylosporangium sp. CA-092794 TaxID=3239929 RepID=UPI003D92CDAF